MTLTGFRSYFKEVLWAITPRAADFGCRIIDNELFIRNSMVTYVSEITNFLFFGKNTLTQVSYHSKTTFATKLGRQNHYLEKGPESFYANHCCRFCIGFSHFCFKNHHFYVINHFCYSLKSLFTLKLQCAERQNVSFFLFANLIFIFGR